MKSFGVCFGFSLLLHVLFFPGFLNSMMTEQPSEISKDKPERVKIRLVKKPKPAPKAVLKPKPKPKVVAVKPKPRVEPKPKPKPKPKVKPKLRPAKLAKGAPKPRPKRRLRKAKPAAKKPKSYPKKKPSIGRPKVPKAAKSPGKPKRTRTKRLSTTGNGASRSQARVVTPDREVEYSRPGEDTGPETWRSPSPEDGPDSGGDEAPVPVKPAEPVEPTAPAEPKRTASRPVPPKPPEPPKRSTPPRRERPDPPPVAKAKKAQITVPTIEPPAKFRKKKLKGRLKVRFKVAADGTFEVSLSDSSGNPEFDDYVLSELRKVAKVEPAIGKDGKPRRSVLRRPVRIKID